MANTWTCPRCSAQNVEAAVTCATCGTLRGGVVVASDAAVAPVAPAPASPSSEGSWPAAPIPPASSADAGWASATAAPPDGAVPPPMPTAPAPGGWPGAPTGNSGGKAGNRAAMGCLANVGIRVALVVGVLVIGAIVAFFVNAGRDSNGNITKSGEVPVTELRVGDCWDPQGDSATFDANTVIEKTNGVPCNQSHHYEVYFVGTISQSTYPTEDESKAWARANCVPAFQTYVGTPFDQSSLSVVWFIPDEKGWAQGDRGAQCSIEDANHKAMTQSMKGSGY